MSLGADELEELEINFLDYIEMETTKFERQCCIYGKLYSPT